MNKQQQTLNKKPICLFEIDLFKTIIRRVLVYTLLQRISNF